MVKKFSDKNKPKMSKEKKLVKKTNSKPKTTLNKSKDQKPNKCVQSADLKDYLEFKQ